MSNFIQCFSNFGGMPFEYEGKCSQRCGTIIHVNSKLGFLNGLCWIEEVPQNIYGECLGLWALWVCCMV